MGEIDHSTRCYLCSGDCTANDSDVDADGYGYHTACEAKRQERISAGICWACNEPIKDGDAVEDNAHTPCLETFGHGDYVGF